MDTNTAGAVVDDSAIAGNVADVANATDTNAAAAAENPSENQQVDKDAEINKLRNALQRKERRIGQLTAREKQALRDLQAVREQTQRPASQQGNQQGANGRPKEEDFPGDYAAFLRADAAFEAKEVAEKHFNEKEANSKKQQETQQQQAWESERDDALDVNADVAAQAFSDFANVMNENLEDIKNIAPHVKRAFLEAENGAFALYNLAKEGKLDALNDMSAYAVAMAVARAEDRAVSASKAKTVTNAPAPITPSRGGGSAGGKTLEKMSGDELLKAIRK